MMKHIAQQFDDSWPEGPLCTVSIHPAFDSLVYGFHDANCVECRQVWDQRVATGNQVYGHYADFADALTNADLWQEITADLFAGEHKLGEDKDEPDWHICPDCMLSHTSDGEVD